MSKENKVNRVKELLDQVNEISFIDEGTEGRDLRELRDRISRNFNDYILAAEGKNVSRDAPHPEAKKLVSIFKKAQSQIESDLGSVKDQETEMSFRSSV